ncbi:hypothetical protein L2E82_14526 [Cichorium intybus]|uniref:Uncharacterized protein n=1 Tax=Cichorium intybus TaxID=13427 RepID=A0ACB9F1E8_CICIN|nr:hypothetical protein L2E82_14526 [Cichorium intybus]
MAYPSSRPSFILMSFLSTLLFFLVTSVQAQAKVLPPDEGKFLLNALREIAKELGKKDWNFDLNPCDGDPSWNSSLEGQNPQFNNSVVCDCSYPGGVCHVIHIVLKGQDLRGVLPPSLAKLPSIQKIDLSFNYLNGTIPPQWASTKVDFLRLENNMFSGTLPPELGKLINLSILVLNANNLTGKLPEEFNLLTNLIELRLSSNNFSGKIPNLGNCTKLKKLEIQGSGLEGPIPGSLSFLRNLTELRISDLTGEGLPFPDLSGMTSMDKFAVDLSYNNFSKITVPRDCQFKPTHGKNYTCVVIGAVGALLCLSLIVLGIAWKRGYIGDQNSRERELRGLDLQTGVFTYRQINAATDKFADSNKLGEGGFGSVYKGTLLNGTLIAVKKLSSKSKQGNREFVNEVGMIAGIQHPNVVRLYGCCVDGNHLLLVYEYMENNSLAHTLFDQDNSKLEIDWPTRQRICVGIAKGLTFLHEESALKMVHRDIKVSNVLLDADLTPKISDFGLAKLNEEENTHITTRVAGTIGYMAPEYALWGYLTYKADVYSFGVLALEIVAGRNNMTYRPSEKYFCLLDWAVVLKQKGSLIDLVDPRLGSNFNKKEAVRMIKIALLCTNKSPALRPTMSEVMNMLEGRIKINEPNVNVRMPEDKFGVKGLGGKFEEIMSHESHQTEISIEPISSSSKDSAS